MRFVQKDSLFNRFEWSETLTDSTNILNGMDAFQEFDFGVLTDMEVKALHFILNNGQYSSVIQNRNEVFYANTPGLKDREFRWFFIDQILNFAPTTQEIIGSLQNKDYNHTLAKEFWEIRRDQFRIQYSDIKRKQINSPYAKELTTLYDKEYNFIIKHDLPNRYVMLTAAVMYPSEMARYGITLENFDKSNLEKGIIPTIKVGNIDYLMSTFVENTRPADSANYQYPILAGTENLSFDGGKGIPQPGLSELIFYFRLKYGIAASDDEKLSEEDDRPWFEKRNGGTSSSTANFGKSVYKNNKLYAPFRMRYVNQFLLPEVKIPREAYERFTINRLFDNPDPYSVITDFEHPGIHFDLTALASRKTLNPTSYTKVTGDKGKQIRKHYFSLWCLRNTEDTNLFGMNNAYTEDTPYIPTGFPHLNTPYQIYTNHLEDSPLYNYTDGDSIHFLPPVNGASVQINWTQKDDIKYSRWFDTNTLGFGDGGFFGLRGGIPCKYISLLKFDAEYKGRLLYKEAEKFSKFLEESYNAGEILPVIVNTEDSKNIFRSPSKKSGEHFILENDMYRIISENYVPEPEKFESIAPSTTETFKKSEKPNYIIQYVSNISDVKNLPAEKLKYHQRPWTKDGTGISAKVSLNFVPGVAELKLWGDTKLFQIGEEDSDYSSDTAYYIPEIGQYDIYKSAPECELGKQDRVYLRPLIQPNFNDIFGSRWLDYPYQGLPGSIEQQLNEEGDPIFPSQTITPNQLESRIYLIISQAASSLLYHDFKALSNLNGEKRLSPLQNQILSELINGSSVQGELLASKEYNNSAKIKRFFENITQTLDDAKKFRSANSTWWATTSITAINHLTSAATKSIFKRADSKMRKLSLLYREPQSIWSYYDSKGNFSQQRFNKLVEQSDLLDKKYLKSLPRDPNVLKKLTAVGKGTEYRNFMHLKPNTVRNMERYTAGTKFLHDKYYKLTWTYTKIGLDLWGLARNFTPWEFTKTAINITNSVLSEWGWKALTGAAGFEGKAILGEKVAQQLLKFGTTGSNLFSWGVTVFFLVIDTAVKEADRELKRNEEFYKPLDEAHKGNFLEGVYIQTKGAVKIKKNKDGSLPIDYNFDEKNVEYLNGSAETIESETDRIIKTQEELMAQKGEKYFWNAIKGTEDCKVLLEIAERKPELLDSAPNHFDLGIHTTLAASSYGYYEFEKTLGPLGWLANWPGMGLFKTTKDSKPFINVAMLSDMGLIKEYTIDPGGNRRVINKGFIPKFKYARTARYNIFPSGQVELSPYFNGRKPDQLEEFYVEIFSQAPSTPMAPPIVSVYKNTIFPPITDKEKIYLIRRKYGLYLIDKDAGKKIRYSVTGVSSTGTTGDETTCCCFLYNNINDKSQYDYLEFPNDGNGRKAIDKYDGIGGCKYKIKFNSQDFIQKLKDSCSSKKDSDPGCFSADTKITTPSGDIEISNIIVGDEVIAFDLEKNLHTSVVTEIFKHDTDSEIYRYVFENGIHIDVTKNHPVFIPSGIFVEIGNLQIGDYVCHIDGTDIKIQSIEFLRNDSVYNFTVENYHTYIANGILVHNKPVSNELPITMYTDETDYLAESIIETRDLNDPTPDLECQKFGICNDDICANCESEPKYIKVCSIPEFCYPPVLTGGISNSIPTWLQFWITYDFRVSWSDITRTVSTIYSWWNPEPIPDVKITYKSKPVPESDNTEEEFNSSLFWLDLPTIDFDFSIPYNENTQTSNTSKPTHRVVRKSNRNTNSGKVVSPIVYPPSTNRIIFPTRNPSDNTRTRDRRTGGAASGAGG